MFLVRNFFIFECLVPCYLKMLAIFVQIICDWPFTVLTISLPPEAHLLIFSFRLLLTYKRSYFLVLVTKKHNNFFETALQFLADFMVIICIKKFSAIGENVSDLMN